MKNKKNWFYGILIGIGTFLTIIATNISKIARHPDVFIDAGKATGKFISHESDNYRYLSKTTELLDEIDNAAKINDVNKIERIIAENGDHILISRFLNKGENAHNINDFIRRMNEAHSSIEEKFGFLFHYDDKYKMINKDAKDEFIHFIEKRKNATKRSRKDLEYNLKLEKLLPSISSNADNSKSLQNSIKLQIQGNDLYFNGTKLTDEQLKEIVIKKPKIFIEGKLNNNIALRLSDSGAKFVMNSKKIPKKRVIPRIVYVVQDNDPVEVIKTFQKCKYGYVVNNEDELKKILDISKKNYERPVIVFNNSNGKLYNKSLSKYGIEDVITCNSYSCSSNSTLTLNSNDILNAQDVVNSLEITYKKYSKDFDQLTSYIQELEILKENPRFTPHMRKSIDIADVIECNPGKTIFLDEFYYNFSLSYNNCVNNRFKRNILVACGFGAFTIGGCSTIVYITKK